MRMLMFLLLLISIAGLAGQGGTQKQKKVLWNIQSDLGTSTTVVYTFVYVVK